MKNPEIIFEIEEYGEIRCELYPEIAPKTVENFLVLVNSGFFDGLIFHRIIEGFMIQGGGYDAYGLHRDAKPIKGEFRANGFAANTLKHTSGVLSMARTMDPNSASSQFFIMHKDAPHLDGQYAAFGKVVSGMDVVDRIAKVRTDFNDAPLDPPVIERAYAVTE